MLYKYATRTTGVPDVFCPVKNFTPHEIYASGGGLLVTPINAPHLFFIVVCSFCLLLLLMIIMMTIS